MTSFFMVNASQRAFIKNLIFSTRDKTWMSFNTSDQSFAISRNWETWERPETGSQTVRGYFGWTFETNDSFWVASFQELIRPVASMNTVIISQTRFTFAWDRFSISTLDIGGWAFLGDWVKSELVFASFGRYRGCWKMVFIWIVVLSKNECQLTIVCSWSAIYSPVVVAVVVNGTFTIEK